MLQFIVALFLGFIFGVVVMSAVIIALEAIPPASKREKGRREL